MEDREVTLRWESAHVAGRRAHFVWAEPAEGPEAPIVLFLHGWGLSAAAYAGAVQELARNGYRVLAPDLPGFGGTAGLPAAETTFPGYAGWLRELLDAVGADGDLQIVGHSFGGGVAACSAGLLGRRVRHLVLVNAVGGGAWLAGADGRVRGIAERPWWDWGLHFPGDLWAPSGVLMLPKVLGGAVPNLVRNPRALLNVANLARTADLGQELSRLRQRGVRVSVVWSERDRIVPRANFDAMCQLLSVEGRVVRGAHAWMIGEPGRFAKVVSELLDAEPARAPRFGAEALLRLVRRSIPGADPVPAPTG